MKKIYDREWQNGKYQDTITISKSYLENLLNCLTNQKYIRELFPENKEKIQEDIDATWKKGMFIIDLQSKMELTYKTMFEKYCEVWNKELLFLENCLTDDSKQYPEDNNILFKWGHLIQQEIEMWISLCCFTNIFLDCEKFQYKHGMVSPDDFNEIIVRRGFTPKMTSFLMAILKEIGIGEELNKNS
jgi:hypothetical protein